VAFQFHPPFGDAVFHSVDAQIPQHLNEMCARFGLQLGRRVMVKHPQPVAQKFERRLAGASPQALGQPQL